MAFGELGMEYLKYLALKNEYCVVTIDKQKRMYPVLLISDSAIIL